MKCDISEYKPENSKNENKSGCMKWYAFNDSESSSTVNVILDHNTTAKVRWSSTNSNTTGGDIIKSKLVDDTKTWNKSLNPRLIEVTEIAKITGNTKFDATNPDKDDYFYFDTNTGSADSNRGPGTSQYKWLFDYTNGCTDWGCSVADNSTNGYWTITPSASNVGNAWVVLYQGSSSYYSVADDSYGVRPVITISKSILQ